MTVWFPYTKADDDKFTRLLEDDGWVKELNIPPGPCHEGRLIRSRYGMRIIACDLILCDDGDGYKSIMIVIERRLNELHEIFFDDED